MNTTEAQARKKIEALIKKYKDLSDSDRKSLSESSVVHQFLDPLLEALGWPVQDPARYKYELNTYAGRPDMTLIPESGGVIFVEAKRFGVIQQLAQARKTLSGVITPGQLALPGMAADRTPQEQQAINYAFQNGGTWAILTNFEKLRLFNARRDWLVLSFEEPTAFLDDFDLFWLLSYENVVNGRLDDLSNQRHREDVDANYLDFINQWRQRLAQNVLDRPAQNPWAFDEAGQVKLGEVRAVVQRVLDRLVVVRFAEDHLVIPAGTLYSFLEMRQRNPYTFSLSQFFQELYRRFDEYHNSALFALHPADQASFDDAVLIGLIQKLYEARYRAMTPDIMGNTYEQYLGKTLALSHKRIETVDNLETRKKQGSYYTPQVIVRYLVDNSLGRYLYGTTDGQPDGPPLAGESRKTAVAIQELRVIDPACGSGSFLIYAYQVLADFYRREIRRLEAEREARLAELMAAGQASPFDLQIQLAPFQVELNRLRDYPRLILENHLYGVDLDPQAAEIATVNLMMRAMADQQSSQRRLPLILNQNIKVGNSLIGVGPADGRYESLAPQLAQLRALRLKMARNPQDPAHNADLKAIEALSDAVNGALDDDFAPQFAAVGLEAIRPFHWAVAFPEVFLDEQGQHKGSAAGFDVVVGNPPWEIIKPDLREYYAQFDDLIESKLTRAQAEKRIAELNADPDIAAGWKAQVARIEASAAYYKQAPDFSRQGRGDTATHKLFTERGYDLLEANGRLAFVIPSGIYRDLGTKELREMLLTEGHIKFLYNFSNERSFFPHVHHDFRFTLLGAQKGVIHNGFWATFRFNPRVAVSPEEMPKFLNDQQNLIFIHQESLAQFSPNSLGVMEFETARDYQIAEKIFTFPHLGTEVEGNWNLDFAREFDMANDSRLFNQSNKGYKLYEGKMVHQFDPFFAEPRYWIEEHLGRNKLRGGKANNWFEKYRFSFREVSNATNERTCIAAILPPQTFAGHTLWVGIAESNEIALYFVSLINSFCVDWISRFKVDKHVTLFVMQSLPIPRLNIGNLYFDAIVPRAARLTCTTPAFADLWQEVMGTPWQESLAATDPGERQRLRDELDAIVAHLYGLTRDEFAHILGTFPLVFPNDTAGEQKKAALLGIYDEFAFLQIELDHE
ncbi:MAG: N-6 DNA methylase [Chloroflexi bacterium]|nr:N-6 DNA methylase [Chloroflexota bacterium]